MSTTDQLSMTLGFISICVTIGCALAALGVAIKVTWWDRRSVDRPVDREEDA